MLVPLIIRADASSCIGTGHVMRMLALAQAWHERCGGEVRFICTLLPDVLEQRLGEKGFRVERITATPGSPKDLTQTLKLAGYASRPQTTDHWLAIDGYPFDLAYQRGIRAAGYKLLVMDDYNHLPAYACDILLNHHAGAGRHRYAVNDEAVLLIGPRYALLRREFREALRSNDWKDRSAHVPTVGKRILITMGGADPHNVTRDIVAALNQSDFHDLHVKIVLGAAYTHRKTLDLALARITSIQYEVIRQATNMPALMRWADCAITAAGSACYELAALGVPMCCLVIAENQRDVANGLREAGAAVHCGAYDAFQPITLTATLRTLLSDEARLSAMSDAGRALVDGHGAERVCEEWGLVGAR